MKYLLLIPILGLLIWITFFSNLFTARKIECFTQFGTCQSSLVAPLSKYKNRKLFAIIDSKKLLSDYKNDPQVVAVSAFRRLPSTLVFNILLRKPIGAISNSVLGAESIIDESGVIYAQASNSSLPLLIVDAPTSLSSDQTRALDVLSQMSNSSPTRLVGQLQDSQLVVNYPQNLIVIVNIHSQIKDWYPALQLILQRSKIDGKLPHKIDMRFKNPVVVF